MYLSRYVAKFGVLYACDECIWRYTLPSKGINGNFIFSVGGMNRIDKIFALLPPVGAESDPESDSENNEDLQMPFPEVDDYTNVVNNEQQVYSSEDEVVLAELLPVPAKKIQTTPVKSRMRNSVTTPAIRSPVPKIKKQTAKATKNFSWTSDDFHYEVEIGEDTFTRPEHLKSPLQYFQTFLTDDIVQLIVEQTNLYSTQQTNKCVDTNFEELQDFLGIELMMGVVHMPAYTDYWALETRYAPIADIMPLKRYQALRRSLHFVDNEDINTDRYFKVRPILEHVRRNCLKIEPEVRNSVDEMMVPYKGTKAGSRRQYIKNKPKKWGFKMFVRCGISGMVYDFFPYAGEDTFRNIELSDDEESLGFGAKVVIALCKTIQNKPLSVVYFDNFFTSLELVSYLRDEFGILSLGTVRSNRLRGCAMKTDKELKSEGRGSFDQKVDNSSRVALVKWFDNKSVTLSSSYVSTNPVETIQRFSKAGGGKVQIVCPQIVKQYNRHMGGVDLADMFVALYRTGMKTHRWYMGLFSQMLDICLNNAWLLYRREAKLLEEDPKSVISLKKFRICVSKSLFHTNKVRVGRPSNREVPQPSKKIQRPVDPRPQDDSRFDNTGHFPVFQTKGRCKNCKTGQTQVFCNKCNIRLCLLPNRNCFVDFHIKK